MYAILQTCLGDGTDVNLTDIPPPGIEIDQENKTWSFRGKTLCIGEIWREKLHQHQPQHPLNVIHFSTEEDFQNAKIAVAAANYFSCILKC